MKNNRIILLSIFTAFILYLGFEISAGKINFGSAWWSDTLSNRITTNKAINLRPGDSLYYNGNVVTSGSGTSIDTSKYYSVYRLDTANIFYRRDTIKIGYLAKSQTWTGSNTFSGLTYTGTIETGNTTVTGDLSVMSNSTFNGYNDFGNTGNFEKMIIVKGKLGTSSAGSTNIAHGFSGNDYLRITNFDCVVRNDTNVSGQLKFVKPGSWFSNYSYYAKVDSLYCNVTLGGGGTNNLVSDSVFFRIWYHP